MADTIIEVENLGKKYLIRHQPRERYLAMRDVVARKAASIGRRILSLKSKQMAAPIREEFWALKDVSFEVKRGEVIGIIGRNGAGKSTLLKLLSRIAEPTEGRIRIRGRVACLLEVGTGFHPELTGRENIYLNGAILGMSKAEIKGKFDEIVAFSEIEKFLDTPVKRYSSGMYVRLAFAVAAHLQPEILLVDEILAVGDVGFQKKCLGKMDEVSKDGRTVLFISHNMAAVEKLCKISLLIDNGGLVMQGSTEKVIDRYLQRLLPNHIQGSLLTERKDRSGNGRIRLTEFHLEDLNGRRIAFGRSGMDMVFVFAYQMRSGECIENVDVGFSIHTADNLSLFVLYTSYLGQNLTVVAPYGEFRCRINRLPLSAGRYRVGARVTVGGEEADWPKDGVGYLDVETGDFFGTGNKGFGGAAPFLIKGQWELSGGR